MNESNELFASVWKDVELMRFLCEPRGRVYSRTQAAVDLFDRMTSTGQLLQVGITDGDSSDKIYGFVSNYSDFALRWNWSWKQVKDFIDGLEKLGFLSVKKLEKKQIYCVRPYMISFPFHSPNDLLQVAIFALENPSISVERTAAYFDEYDHLMEKKCSISKTEKKLINIHRTKIILQLMFGALSGFGCGYSMRTAVVRSVPDDLLYEKSLVSFDGKAAWNWKKWVLVLRQLNEQMSKTQDHDAVRFVDLTVKDREGKLLSWLPFLRPDEVAQVAELTDFVI